MNEPILMPSRRIRLRRKVGLCSHPDGVSVSEFLTFPSFSDNEGRPAPHSHRRTPATHAETAASSSSGVVVAEAEVEVGMPKQNAVRSHWTVVTAFTHVAPYKYNFKGKRFCASIEPQRISDPRGFLKDSAIPGMSPGERGGNNRRRGEQRILSSSESGFPKATAWKESGFLDPTHSDKGLRLPHLLLNIPRRKGK
ncbi:hypothetical protein BJV77DRAFT_968026 [Russula vinacea]|nr:hypothetical protein BJV77DRAFT_968026 [Russula vinacea]